jgi:hypothetical protein
MLYVFLLGIYLLNREQKYPVFEKREKEGSKIIKGSGLNI